MLKTLLAVSVSIIVCFFTMKTPFFTLSLLAPILAASDYSFDGIKHYPPINSTIGDLDQVFNASSGTNGGFYNTTDTDAYNFCNMPHVRKDKYKGVDGDYKLEYVEVVHRHHKRTPYAANNFPKNDLLLKCDDALNVYGSKFTSRNGSDDTVGVEWSVYLSPDNPFSETAPYENTTCQFPQITFGGLQDSYSHGSDLWGVYGELLDFLPKEYSPDKVNYRVTNNVITSEVVSAVVKAMYPEEESVRVDIQVDGYDSLEPSITCDFADAVFSDIKSTDEWADHLNRSHALFEKLDAISGVDPNSSQWHVSWDHYFDNTAFRQCHGYPLAENFTQEDAEQIYRLGDWEWNYMYRVNQNSSLYSALHFGAYLNELTSRLQSKVNGTSPLVYTHNVAHDGSVGPLLSALSIDHLRWPGMGSEVVFELYSKDEEHFIRILYSGEVLNTTGPLGKVDLVPVDEFVDYIHGLIGENAAKVVEYCIN